MSNFVEVLSAIPIMIVVGVLVAAARGVTWLIERWIDR